MTQAPKTPNAPDSSEAPDSPTAPDSGHAAPASAATQAHTSPPPAPGQHGISPAMLRRGIQAAFAVFLTWVGYNFGSSGFSVGNPCQELAG